jgi:RimJ/RimL family protein N-acetyltransferase
MKPLDLWKTPVNLAGNIVRLEPLNEMHIPALVHAGRDPTLWKYMLYGDLTNEKSMTAWVLEMLRRQQAGTDLPFAVFHIASECTIGATRFLEMRPSHRSLEIGGTWLAQEFHGSGVNIECKYMMLKYAFEAMNCIRVQFKVDARNERSIRAIERLGAVREGVIRNHLILQDGTLRDSIYFSTLDREWATTKKILETQLKRI